jgi:hypothetical protein
MLALGRRKLPDIWPAQKHAAPTKKIGRPLGTGWREPLWGIPNRVLPFDWIVTNE